MKKILFSLLAATGLAVAHAQVPGGLDASFQPAATNNPPYQVAVQPTTGQTLVAGPSLSNVNGVAVGPIARLSANGTLDQTFVDASAGYLTAGDTVSSVTLAVQPDGKILACVGGQPSYHYALVRLNADGSLDNSFTATVDANVSIIKVQSDGKILIGGSFSTLNGLQAESGSIARLNADGATDSAFSTASRDGDPSLALLSPSTIDLQSDGKIIVTGYGDQTFDGVLERLNTNGSRDLSYAYKDLPNTYFEAVAVLPGDKVVAAYNTGTFGTEPYPYAVRLDPTGQIDPSFNTGSVFSFPFIKKILPQADGKIVFATNGTNNNPLLVRLSATGEQDREFAQGFLYASSLFDVAQQSDGKLVVGGTVYLPNGILAGVVRVLTGGVTDAATVSVLVPALANPWLAGAGAVDSNGDNASAEAPVRVTGLTLTPGNNLTFTATGAVYYSPTTSPPDGPDGETAYPYPHPVQNGLGGATAPVDALMGVFIDDSAADPTNAHAPATLDFTTAGGTPGTLDFATLAPQLGQVFFIGDGKNTAGAAQQFTVPAGATHLVLGTMDGTGWYNNSGAFVVTISGAGGTGGGGGGGGILVPGTANVWLAGQPDGTAALGYDVAPAESPVQVTGLTFDPNQSLTFSATGGTGNGVLNSTSPDGDSGFADHPSENSLGEIHAPTNSLVGVFLSDAVPTVGKSTAIDINYQQAVLPAGGTNYSAFQPIHVGDVFFIGDGKDALGNPQQIYPPEGATRLYLGSLDAAGNNDNTGAFRVTVAPGGYAASDLLLDQTATAGGTTGGNDAAVAFLGNTITYTYRIDNRSAQPVTNVVLTAQLPSQTTFVGTEGTGGTFDGANTVVWTIPSVPPVSTGGLYQVKLTVRVVPYAPLEDKIYNSLVHVRADHYPETYVHNQQPIILRGPIQFAVTSNAATAKPGDLLTYNVAVTNTSYGTTKGATVTVPIPDSTQFVEAYFLDKNGVRVDAARQGGNLVFNVGKIASGATLNLIMSVRVPYDVDPHKALALSGVHIDIPNAPPATGNTTFTVADFPTPLSGSAPSNPPHFSLVKFVPSGTTIFGLLLFNDKARAALEGLYPALESSQDNILALGQIVNPYIIDTTGDDGTFRQAVLAPGQTGGPTVSEITYALLVSNDGGVAAEDVVLTDRIPQGVKLETGAKAGDHPPTINGKPFADGAVTTEDGGQTVHFALGEVKPDKPATATKPAKPSLALVLYTVKVQKPGSAKGVSLGASIQAQGGHIDTTSLLNTTYATPDEIDTQLVAPAGAYVEGYKGTPIFSVGQNASFDLYYRNTGGIRATDFRIVDSIPVGTSFVSADLLDDNRNVRQANGSKGESIETPGTGATSGDVVYHLGAVKPGKDSWVRLTVHVEPSALNADGVEIQNLAYVASDSFPGGITARQPVAGRRHPRDAQLKPPSASDVSTLMAGRVTLDSAYVSQLLQPPPPRLCVTIVAPLSVQEGNAYDCLVSVANLTDTDASKTAVAVPIPPGAQWVEPTPQLGEATPYQGQDEQGRAAVIFPSSYADDGTHTIDVHVPPHKAISYRVTFRAPAGTAGKGLITSAHTEVTAYSPKATGGTPLNSVYTGQVTTYVYGQSVPFANVKSQVVAAWLANGGDASTILGSDQAGEHIAAITPQTQGYSTGGADVVALNNNVAVIPLGAPVLASGGRSNVGNVLAFGAAANIVAQGGGNLIGQDGNGIVAQGGGNLLTVNNLIGQDGNGIVAQGGGNLQNILAGIVAQGGGNIVAQGGGNIYNAGGANLIGQDGNGISSLISNDGGSLTPLGSGLAAGIVAAGGGNLVNANGSNIVAQGGGNIVAQGGGNIVAQGGGNLINVGGGSTGASLANAAADVKLSADAAIGTNFSGAGLGSFTGGNLVNTNGSNIVAQGGGN